MLDRNNDGKVNFDDVKHGASEIDAALRARQTNMRNAAIIGVAMLVIGVWIGAVLFGA